jgi:hypothetical protein
MEESKLFKSLWRFNAIVIAAAGVFALISVLVTIGVLVYEFTGNRNQNKVVNIDPETETKESFRLGRIQHIEGAGSVLVPLYSNQTFSQIYSSGSKSSRSIRNILFSNMREETNTWLLPSSKFLITQHILVGNRYRAERREDVVSVFYHVVKSDTNGDKKLTSRDKLTLALSTPEGERYTEVIEEVDNVLGYDLLDKEAIAVMFNRGGQGYIAYINLSDFSVKKEIELPKVVSE